MGTAGQIARVRVDGQESAEPIMKSLMHHGIVDALGTALVERV